MNKKSLTLIVFSLFLNAFLFAQDYQAYIKKGDQYYQQFKNQEALAEYKKAYKIAPDNYDVLTRLIRAYNDVGEDIGTDDAEPYFIEAINHSKILYEKFPNKAETYFHLVVSQGNLAQLKGGKEKIRLGKNIETYAKKIIELDAKFYQGYVILGVYYREVANLNWALKNFAKIVLGSLPNATNEDSAKMLLKSIEIKPSVIGYFELGITYKEMGLTDKSIESFKKALALPVEDHQDIQRKTLAKEMIEKFQKDR